MKLTHRTNISVRVVTMCATILSLKLVIHSTAVIAGSFAPAAGQPGSTAIAHDSSDFVAWATGWSNYQTGTLAPDLAYQTPDLALGAAHGAADAIFDIVSLGRGGEITLSFDSPITNGTGFDFAVFENSFSDTFLELAYVSVSSTGESGTFIPFKSISDVPDFVPGFGSVDPTDIDGLAGKYRGGFGTPFDLNEFVPLLDQLREFVPSFDPNHITHVKITDVVGDGSNNDTDNPSPIYDPYPTFQSVGFDLEAIGVINQLDEPPIEDPAIVQQVPIPAIPLVIQAMMLILITAIKTRSREIKQ